MQPLGSTAKPYILAATASLAVGVVAAYLVPKAKVAIQQWRVQSRIKELVNSAELVVFMKGEKTGAKCKFSKRVTEALESRKFDYVAINILEDEALRAGLKTYSNWPTFPQIFAGGDFVGGVDVIEGFSEEEWRDLSDKTMPIAKVTAVNIYPVKSGLGVSLDVGEVGPGGFVHDREWMVVSGHQGADGHHRFVSQRTHPKLVWVEASVKQDGSLRLLWEGNDADSLHVLVAPEVEESKITVGVWKSVCNAVDQGDEVAEWLSQRIGDRVRLVRMESNFSRAVAEKHLESSKGRTSADVSFADGFPYLLASVKSLQSLNGAMKKPLGMERFRPNIVVDSDRIKAWEEDEWETLAFGKSREMAVVMDFPKPCDRCKLTTVDPVTAKPGSQSAEPLVTLGELRKGIKVGAWYPKFKAEAVYFGWNGVTRSCKGSIKVGDAVWIVSRRKPLLTPNKK